MHTHRHTVTLLLFGDRVSSSSTLLSNSLCSQGWLSTPGCLSTPFYLRYKDILLGLTGGRWGYLKQREWTVPRVRDVQIFGQGHWAI